MSSGMPELGSKISLISKADIRYEGRLFTVDPQECTIALASVRSFGTEDRETQFPVLAQNQVYDYILFRGSDIKDIRVVNNVQSMPNDPAIMKLSGPPQQTMGGYPPQAQQPAPGFAHPMGYPTYHPMAASRPPMQPSELGDSGMPLLGSAPGAHMFGQGPPPQQQQNHQQPPPPALQSQAQDQGAMLELISGGSQHNNLSRSATPTLLNQRKSPTNDQGTQVCVPQQRDNNRRPQQQQHNQNNNQRYRNNSRNRNNQNHMQSGQQLSSNQSTSSAGTAQPNQQQPQTSNQNYQQQNNRNQSNNYGSNNQYQRGGGNNNWRGRGRPRGGSGPPGRWNARTKNTLKFDSEYDFEQANTEFEELKNQLAKVKIGDGDGVKPEGEVEKKEDSGNETGGADPEVEEDPEHAKIYDKTRSFFDNISCEAVERSKGRSQRTDWRTERKLNSETFGVASARRGMWRPRSSWRPHYQGWRGNRGGGQHNQSGGQHQGGQYQPRSSEQNMRSVPSRPRETAQAK